MSLLIESIKLHDGIFYNLFYHEQRMARALKALFGKNDPLMLEEFLNESPFPQKGLYKCRIVYDALVMQKEYVPYEARSVKTLKLVVDDNISYAFKFADRTRINQLFDMRKGCDDVLIVCNDKITDCSYSNIVFNKSGEWFTPASPLLEGTMRQQLIEKNKIKTREIEKRDIRSFDSFKIINAMLGFDSPAIDVSNIVF